jgi:hypothetical protein
MQDLTTKNTKATKGNEKAKKLSSCSSCPSWSIYLLAAGRIGFTMVNGTLPEFFPEDPRLPGIRRLR